MPSKRDTARDHHRVIDPAEAEVSEINRAQVKGHRTAKARAEAKVGESSLKGAFPTQEVYHVNPEDRQFRRNVLRCWAVLDCGAAKSIAGAEPAAMLAQACEKRGRNAGDDRKVEPHEENYNFRGIGGQVITSFTKLQVPGALGGQDVHYAPSITDGSTPTLVGNDHLLP